MGDTIPLFDEHLDTSQNSLPSRLSNDIAQQIEYSHSKNKTSDGSPYIVFAFAMTAICLCTALYRVFKAPGGFTLQRPELDFKDSNHQIRVGCDLNFSAEELDNILQKHSVYYRQLCSSAKSVFVKRVNDFIYTKTFVICNYTPFREMPVLLSAAAIQITFGLERYQLPWFNVIKIHPHSFRSSVDHTEIVGSVKGRTISVAWNEFIKDMREPTDGVNVGLHEMAHALQVQKLEINQDVSQQFSFYFEKVLNEGQELYQLKHRESQYLFSNYAYTHLDEFWAESVEIFFERPAEMQQHYPELFETLCLLLNQNPLNIENPVLSNLLS